MAPEMSVASAKADDFEDMSRMPQAALGQRWRIDYQSLCNCQKISVKAARGSQGSDITA
jgi:hypothetical protein